MTETQTFTGPIVSRDEIKQAKIAATQRGDYSKAGGWIYSRTGYPICHGWKPYARLLRGMPR